MNIFRIECARGKRDGTMCFDAECNADAPKLSLSSLSFDLMREESQKMRWPMKSDLAVVVFAGTPEASFPT